MGTFSWKVPSNGAASTQVSDVVQFSILLSKRRLNKHILGQFLSIGKTAGSYLSELGRASIHNLVRDLTEPGDIRVGPEYSNNVFPQRGEPSGARSIIFLTD